MRPVQVEMEGFGAFRDPTTIDFRGIDLVALVGDTGAGKSTIIDAITFALYGEVARYGDARLVAPAINQTSQQAKVRLDFELGGQLHTAVRVVRRTKTGATTREARLERGSDVLAADAAGMTRTVEELLGLTADQFNRTVVLPQGRFADFLHDKPADRQETLRKLLGLEMYQRIGAAARTQASERRAQVAMLQPEVEARAAELTDEQRETLSEALSAVTEARATFDQLDARLGELRVEIASVSAEADQLDHRIELLEAVEAPSGIDELDAELRDARAAQQAAALAVDVARTAAKAASDAVTAGPDIPTVRLQLELHDRVDTLTTEHERLTAEVADAQAASSTADERAAEIRSEQARLDERQAALRVSEDAARRQLADHPSLPQLDAWLDAHRRATAAAEEVKAAETAASTATSSLEPLTARRDELVAARSQAQELVADAQRRAGVTAHASMLAVGQPCPLCLQEVHTLPVHAVDNRVEECERALTLAAAAERSATQDWDQADAALRNATALLIARQRTLDDIGPEVAALDSVEILLDRRVEVDTLTSAADEASADRQRAEAAADDHRLAAANRTLIDAAAASRESLARLNGTEATVREQLDAARARLADVPGRAELTASLEDAVRLRDTSTAAAKEFETADAECIRTMSELQQVEGRSDTGLDALHSARDQVAALAPPALPRDSLAAGWHTLTDWAAQQRELSAARHVDLSKRLEEASTASNEALSAMRAACERALDAIDSAASPATLGVALTRRETEAELAIAAFDERRVELRTSQERLQTLAEDAAVAGKLASLLRADGFEGWLMEEALEGLVDRATERLHELSAEQYSLVLVDRAFWVRDHANADELRNVKTLSGGETFLASLSLALALSDATAALAPEGAPELESIFLDEGFGTLDPQTLDAVASAIEELGASGRLVGVITHIRELAERMPVRLEVTKSGGTAHVVRVEA